MASLANIWNGLVHGKADERAPRIAKDEESSAEIIVVGDFRLDLDSRTATVRGHLLDLSPAEFDVLVYLTGHRKRVVTSRTTLAKQSENHEVRQPGFPQNLLSLRKKLQDVVPDAHYVRTDAWVLYDFEPGISEH